MTSINFAQLVASVPEEDLQPRTTRKLGPGTYRTQVVMAKYGHSRSGREMYTITLVISEGPHRGHSIRWFLTIVEEYPNLVERFFADMLKLGVDKDFLKITTDTEEIIRKIILTGAYLDVELREGRGDFLDVVAARRVIVP